MSYEKKLCVHMSFNIKRHRYTSVISWWYSSTPGCSGLRYLSVIIGNPSSGSVNQSHGGSCVMINSCAVQERGSVIPAFVWGVSVSRATSMFARHRLIASNESATSSALVSQSKSSGRVDRKWGPPHFSGVWIAKVSFLPPSESMSDIVARREGIVLWSIICCM